MAQNASTDMADERGMVAGVTLLVMLALAAILVGAILVGAI